MNPARKVAALARPVRTGDFKLAIENIAAFGETDVYPHAIDRYVLSGNPDESVGILESMQEDLAKARKSYPLVYENAFIPSGGGLRGVTQLDPLWNALLLGMVCSVAEAAEKVRIPVRERRVHSNRYAPASSGLFDRSLGYSSFRDRAELLAADARYVTRTDIADFFPHLQHRHVERGLRSAGVDNLTIDQIMTGADLV